MTKGPFVFNEVLRYESADWVKYEEAVQKIKTLCAKLGINTGILQELELQEAKPVGRREIGEQFYHVNYVKLIERDTFTVSFPVGGEEFIQGDGLTPKQG